MSDENSSNGYKVGYRKPPKHTQFKKGRSGNPAGRRKQAPNLDSELSDELNSSITINENGKRRRIPKVRGILKQVSNRALAGDIRAARFILTHYEQMSSRAALLIAEQPGEIGTNVDPKRLTTEQLEQWVAKELEKIEKEEKSWP